MSDGPGGDKPVPSSLPGRTPTAETARAAREAREAQALRANLRRRKDQARGRSESGPDRPADTVAARETGE